MKDKCGIIVNCTLWEDFAFLLKDYLDKHENVPVILLLHLEKIKETQGAYGVSIQNSMYGSRLFTNEDLKDIEDYKNGVLIKERASDIKQQMIDEEGEFDSKDIPEAIDRILGKKLAFRFKAIPNNTRYSMSQISEDEDLIMLLLKRLPTYELARIELEMSDSSVKHGDDIAYIQSLLAIGDFDHESSKSVTPAKRGFMISESQLESVPFEDLSLIQLSCSKLSKHIKS
ncbi:hypothetical protein GLYMA_16G121400v4 [Glycine max]|uniref:Uncharacterized protein n=3 Tax=Glycine max TaxID=3847 RepID=A0A0R0G083_SOYBN|nr:hypothetical protein GYH30_044897 [Glycine max]KAH1151146.1 hypothetical protein GYH30_044897 [Glycine max]KRH07967.1 hypothetical protein GLYMA_16G121400v4 [Glycine max]KRH07968.1 hypothetical protein GLYMA_16G121400v4 [Glycine max]